MGGGSAESCGYRIGRTDDHSCRRSQCPLNITDMSILYNQKESSIAKPLETNLWPVTQFIPSPSFVALFRPQAGRQSKTQLMHRGSPSLLRLNRPDINIPFSI